MSRAFLLLALSAGCGLPGPTANCGLIGEWSTSGGTDAFLHFSLVTGPRGVEGGGSGEFDAANPPFTISALEWGRMSWTFSDGSTIEYEVEAGPEQVCPGDPHNPLGPLTIATIRLHRTGGTYEPDREWWSGATFQRTPLVRIQCSTATPTGGH